MNAPSRRPTRALSLVIGLALGLAACTDGPDLADTPTAPATDPDGTEDPRPSPINVDWNDADTVVGLANGWHVVHCEGDAPLLCVHDGDTLLGVIEAASWPIDDELAAVLDSEGTDAALTRHVADYHDTFEADRTEGCGEDYEYVAHETERVTLAGTVAVRYGFSGLRDGVEVERNVNVAGVLDGRLRLIVAVANVPESCVHSDEFVELAPSQLARLEPYLIALAAGSVLPPTEPTLDGAVASSDG